MDLDRRRECLATGGVRVGVTGVRRILNNAADRALAAGPPTKAQEAWYAATWAGTLALAVVLPIIGRRLRS